MKTIVKTTCNQVDQGVNTAGGMLLTATSVELVTRNINRIFFSVDNLDTLSSIFINFGDVTVSQKGLRIKAGGRWEMGNCFNISSITAICETTTGANISFMEY